MIECRHCREVFSGDPDEYRARCPRCREPLYERAGWQWPRREAADPEAARCVVHANNPSVGTCKRCGNFMCAVCRTRWQERALCLACIERALDSKEARPEDVRAHRRQATLALVFGIIGWGLVLLASLPVVLVNRASSNASDLFILAGLVTLVSMLPALFGVGQGAAAIRVRGERLLTATCGLVLCGAQLGVMLGAMMFAVWTS
jgi:hypothetical protein